METVFQDTDLISRYEKDRLWKEASRCYKEALEIKPDHEDARERIHQIRIMLSQQVCFASCVMYSVIP